MNQMENKHSHKHQKTEDKISNHTQHTIGIQSLRKVILMRKFESTLTIQL